MYSINLADRIFHGNRGVAVHRTWIGAAHCFQRFGNDSAGGRAGGHADSYNRPDVRQHGGGHSGFCADRDAFSTGNQALSVNSISVGGANAGDFREADNCGLPTVLQPTNSCFISIVFTPSAAGARTAQVNVADNAPGSPQSFALSGTGTGGRLPRRQYFVPGTLNFPSTVQGSTSLPLSVTVANSGNAPLNISAIVLGGSNPTDFSAPAGNCIGAAIAPTASCTVIESFFPASSGATGLRQATLIFTDNSGGSPHSINVMGTATAAATTSPILRFSPSPIVVPPTTQGAGQRADQRGHQ